ncbi:hypothetical protein EDB19DRAFT_379798 [Suillus lakei]|nr:hypothetical protein EDB19DRAFT_379798 [Suillus lakei]
MSLPAMDRIFVTSAWLQSIIYGVNCVLFGVCMYAMFHRHKRAHWTIPASCIFHFSIATAHNILSLFYALQGLTNPAIISVPDGSILYFLRITALSMTMSGLYILNVLVLNLLLIWRLYLVWNRNLILAIVMLIVEAVHLAIAIASWAVIIRFGVVFSTTFEALLKACFTLNLALTISLTSGIAYRLWRAGKDVCGLTDHNAYRAAIYTIIECGAIYTSSIVVLCAMNLSGSDVGIMANYVGIQIATLAPLLLIASLSLDLHGENNETLNTMGPIFTQPVQVNITEEIRTYPDDTTDSRPAWKNQRMRSCDDNEKGH